MERRFAADESSFSLLFTFCESFHFLVTLDFSNNIKPGKRFLLSNWRRGKKISRKPKSRLKLRNNCLLIEIVIEFADTD